MPSFKRNYTFKLKSDIVMSSRVESRGDKISILTAQLCFDGCLSADSLLFSEWGFRYLVTLFQLQEVYNTDQMEG
jgi:hypothetical protein